MKILLTELMLAVVLTASPEMPPGRVIFGDSVWERVQIGDGNSVCRPVQEMRVTVHLENDEGEVGRLDVIYRKVNKRAKVFSTHREIAGQINPTVWRIELAFLQFEA